MADVTWIPKEGGGGGGSGTVTSVNVSGGATGLTFTGGPITTVGTITANISLATNSFMASNSSGAMTSYGEWNLDETTKFSNVQIPYQPNNLAVFPTVFNWNVNVDPLQNSPNDGLAIHSFNANLDSAATGFDLGTNGDAAQLVVGGFSYQGNGGIYGRLRHINNYSNLGNGTDPFTFKGFSTCSQSFTVNANTTIDGNVSGYDFNLNANAAAVSTSNFSVSVFTDFSQIPIDCYGYQGLIIQPSVSKIKNGANFSAININPVVTDLEGNAGFFGINVGGQITNQSASNGYQGVSINPNIVHLTQSSSGLGIFGQTTDGTADWTAANISTSQIVTTGTVKALQINTANDGSQFAIDATGHCNMNTALRLQSSLVQQYGHIIGGEIQFDDGVTPANTTGTDTLANNMAFTVNTGLAGSSWTAAGPVGLTTLGFVGQIVGDGNAVGAINFCLNGYNPIVNGTIDRVNNFSALCIPNSGTGTITEAVLYYGDGPFGLPSANTWGLRIEDSTAAGLENFLTRLAIGTSNKKVSSANVILDLFDGHIHVDQTTAPAVAANSNAGTGASAVLTDASDIAGKIELTMGSGSFSSGTQLTVTFDKTYAVAPVVVISAANQAAVSSVVHHEIHLDNITTTGFDIAFGVQENVAGTVYKWNYFVVGV